MDRQSADYEGDFYAWTIQQAAAIRRVAELRPNEEVDWENVAEEIESLGRNELDTVYSHLETIIEHLLKLAYSPASDPRADRRVTVMKARGQLARKLTGSLRPKLREELADAWMGGRKDAVAGLAEDGLSAADIPADCPWTFEQLLDEEFWPETPARGDI
ncbi:MAG TPA: DUF29 domain-containing protein [Azospirillaceae bacterium]|nr:DUF29 domain-containing protein [Azospirillaceae bacterium]HRQ81217.1 DUF29 domain-containing protein [Azospirillaceae bacterium]